MHPTRSARAFCTLSRFAVSLTAKKMNAFLLGKKWHFDITILFILYASTCDAFIPTTLLQFASVSVNSLTHSDISEHALLISAAKLFNTYRNPLLVNELSENVVTSAENMFKEFYGMPMDVSDFLDVIDRVSDAVGSVDLNEETQSDPTWHFDAERFYLANANLKSLWNQIVSAINGSDFVYARTQVGRYHHPLQDFYSHSNWVEMGNTGTNDALGVDGAFLGLVADANTPTCSSCKPTFLSPFECMNNILSAVNEAKRLTSGYYGGESIGNSGMLIVKPTGKCSHGGQRDTSRSLNAEGGIAKDGSNSMFAPHHYLHAQASNIALAATIKFFDRLRLTVGDEKFSGFLNIQWPLTRLIPTTRRIRIQAPKRSSKITLLKVNENQEKTRTITFFVDSLLTAVEIQVKSNSQVPEVALTTPNGSPNPGEIVTRTKSEMTYRVNGPVVGPWKVNIQSEKPNWDAEIRATSTFDIRTHFELPNSAQGKHSGSEKIENNPIIGDSVVLIVRTTCEKCQLKAVHFLQQNGSSVATYPLRRAAARNKRHFYTADVVIPGQQFYVEVTGIDAGQNSFQRLHASLINPTQIRINAPSWASTEAHLPPAFDKSATLLIGNQGPPGVFDLSLEDPAGLIADFTPKVLTLKVNESQAVTFRISVPENAAVGQRPKVDLFVRSRDASTSNFNFFTKEVTIVQEKTDVFPPTCAIISSNFNTVCEQGASINPAQCSKLAWKAEVLFKEQGDGIDGVFVTSPNEENLFWTKSETTAKSVEGKQSEFATTVTAAGTCCSTTVTFLMVDNVGLSCECVLKQRSA